MKIDFEQAHDCEKCHGKIVLIEIDMSGNTYCGYCHQKVNYGKCLKTNPKSQ